MMAVLTHLAALLIGGAVGFLAFALLSGGGRDGR